VVIAGGTEAAITPVTIAGFARAGALARRADDPSAASRPFDADRNGFVLAEGAGVVILERAEHARARGARIRASLKGAGIAADAFHITSPHPEGAGQIDAIGKALAQARLAPADIDHVNAHATGTVVGDIAEALALCTSLGTSAAVTAPKASLGHLVGAGGAVEAILTVLSVETGTIPPTRNLDKLPPDIDLDVVTAQPRQVKVNAAISNSFGFGGQNVTLLFTKP
jgi:3-oxoacyl-[acyl-carrier-protein] synthase II